MSKNGAQVAMEGSTFAEMFKKSVEETPNPSAKPALWVNHAAGEPGSLQGLAGQTEGRLRSTFVPSLSCPSW